MNVLWIRLLVLICPVGAVDYRESFRRHARLTGIIVMIAVCGVVVFLRIRSVW